jgi:hypothetical protein
MNSLIGSKHISEMENYPEDSKEMSMPRTMWYHSTLAEFREKFVSNLEDDKELLAKITWMIFNSIFNRTPNLTIPKVLKEKLKYIFGIGCGYKDVNFVPVSWIDRFLNFLMKDRGNIMTLLCKFYDKSFPMKIVRKVLTDYISELKSQTLKWEEDISLSSAISILEKVKKYVDRVIKENSSQKIKLDDQTISIKNICDNVPEFGEKLNSVIVMIQVRTDSITNHCQEILGMNDVKNVWTIFQKALLNLVQTVMTRDGNDLYLRSTLNLENLREYIKTVKVFNSIPKSGSRMFTSALTSHKKKMSEFNEVIPIRFLAIRHSDTPFENRAAVYYVTDEDTLSEQFMVLYEKQITFKDARKNLEDLKFIIEHTSWTDYQNLQEELLDSVDDDVDTNNLEASIIEKEDFGLACVDAVMELRLHTPGMRGRQTTKLLETIIPTFVECLCASLKRAQDSGKLASSSKSMDSRFKMLILPAFKDAKKLIEGNDTSKDKIFAHQLEAVRTYIKDKKGNLSKTSFVVLKYGVTLETTEIVFDPDCPRKECGLQLGRKKQSVGYEPSNCFLQESTHNETLNNEDFDYEDSIDFMKWFARQNKIRVNDNMQYFLKNEMYDVIADANALDELFNSDNDTLEKFLEEEAA